MSELGGMLDEARSLAVWTHSGQKDKAGNDYFTAHVQDVVGRLEGSDHRVLTVAYLHDVIEDGPTGALAYVAWMFPPDIVEAVKAITHIPHEPRVDYYARVRANSLALKAKLADIASNTDPARVALLEPGIRGRLTEKYKTAIKELTR